MKPSLRKVLADSHVCVVAIAVLVFFSLNYAFWAALSWPLVQSADFLVTAVAIRGIPSGPYSITNPFTVLATALYLFYSLACLATAELISRSVYGLGTFRCLRKYAAGLSRKNNV